MAMFSLLRKTWSRSRVPAESVNLLTPVDPTGNNPLTNPVSFNCAKLFDKTASAVEFENEPPELSRKTLRTFAKF